MTDYEYSTEIVQSVLGIIEELNELQDVDTILDKILSEARKLTGADAATIFLIENDTLVFNCVQNETLFNRSESIVESYKQYSVPISLDSFVGYTALTGQSLLVDDVYNTPEYFTCSFNSTFDEQTGYTTRSLYTIPLKIQASRVVGVMQLINAKDRAGNLTTFNSDTRLCMPMLANHAAISITRGIFTRQLILRMMKMAELRDPSETGAHVQRVGAYAAEIYQYIAIKRGLNTDQINYNKNVIRLAAMLHDVGKVGISDTILKKPAKLTSEEFQIVKMHTIYGFELFTNITSDIDKMSRQIALNHHERWDGTGYPSNMAEYGQLALSNVSKMEKDDIPLAARITAVADVFDALSSRRCYKEPFSQDKVLAIIQEGAGSHFDPEVVDALFDIIDLINVIQEKYQEDQAVEDESQSAMFFQTRSAVRDSLVGRDAPVVFEEILEILHAIAPKFDTTRISAAYNDAFDLFSGHYPGYKAATSDFYDFNHTMAVALAYIRLAHGTIINGTELSPAVVELGLICAFFHDSGLIEKEETGSSSSTILLQDNERRSAAFLKAWLKSRNASRGDMENCASILRCTNMNCLPESISFYSKDIQVVAYILGTSDILAQMADRMYLEKLPILVTELQAGKGGDECLESRVFHETEHFFNTVVTERLFGQFNGVAKNMRSHFRVYKNIDCDPYLESVTGQIQHISFLDIKCNGNYEVIQEHLRRKR